MKNKTKKKIRFYFILDSSTTTEQEIKDKTLKLSVIHLSFSSFDFKTQIWVRRGRDLIELNKIFPKNIYLTKTKVCFMP